MRVCPEIFTPFRHELRAHEGWTRPGRLDRLYFFRGSTPSTLVYTSLVAPPNRPAAEENECVWGRTVFPTNKMWSALPWVFHEG